MKNILIIQPFRKPKFKEMVVTNYPFWEVINVAPLVTAAILKESYNVQFLSLQNIFKSYESNQSNELFHILNLYNPELYFIRIILWLIVIPQVYILLNLFVSILRKEILK